MSESLCTSCGAPNQGLTCPKCGFSPSTPPSRRGFVLRLVVGIAGAGFAGYLAKRFIQDLGATPSGNWDSEWLSGASGLEKAGELQKTSMKPLLVYFYTDWCGYCRRLEANVLATQEGVDAIRDVIKVRMNPEDSRDEARYAQNLGVRGYPTLLIALPGEPPRRVRTPQSPSELKRLFGA